MLYITEPKGFKKKYDIVSCYLEHQGEVLFLCRKDDKPQGNTWCAPGGKVEKNELTTQAIQRELQEETSYACSLKDLNFAYTAYVTYPDFHFTYHVFHIFLKERPEIVLDDAHKDFKWLTPQEALKLNLIQDEDASIKLFYKC